MPDTASPTPTPLTPEEAKLLRAAVRSAAKYRASPAGKAAAARARAKLSAIRAKARALKGCK